MISSRAAAYEPLSASTRARINGMLAASALRSLGGIEVAQRAIGVAVGAQYDGAAVEELPRLVVALDGLIEVGKRLVAVAAVVLGHAAGLVGAGKAGLQLEHLGEIADRLVEVAGAPVGGAAIEVSDVHLRARQATAVHDPGAGGGGAPVLCCGATCKILAHPGLRTGRHDHQEQEAARQQATNQNEICAQHFRLPWSEIVSHLRGSPPTRAAHGQ